MSEQIEHEQALDAALSRHFRNSESALPTNFGYLVMQRIGAMKLAGKLERARKRGLLEAAGISLAAVITAVVLLAVCSVFYTLPEVQLPFAGDLSIAAALVLVAVVVIDAVLGSRRQT